jgi:hypothetical protein
MSGNSSVTDIINQAGSMSMNPPGPGATPDTRGGSNNILPPSDQIDSNIATQRAIAADLLQTFAQFATASPNVTQSQMVGQIVDDLRSKRDTLAAEIESLETVAQADNIPFVEESPDVTGISREKIFTLQDYILFILVSAYGFAFLALLLLIGKRTEWNKKALLYTLGGGVIVTVLLYILLKKYV